MDEQPELPLNASSGELAFEPHPELMAQLAKLLPREWVMVRNDDSGVTSPHVFSLALGLIRDALSKGHLIDRSNGDDSLALWDGWLVVHAPIKVSIRSNWKTLV